MSADASVANVLTVATTLLRDQIPYKFGGSSTSGMDSPGLVYYAFQQLKINVGGPRANQQFYQGNNVPVGPEGNALAYAQPGDVIFQGTSDPNTETEGIVYSTIGNGTIITSKPGVGVTYSTITGAIDGIRRYSGAVTGYDAAPYSSTTPHFLSDLTDVQPVETVTSSPDGPTQPVTDRNYSREHLAGAALGLGVILVVLLHKKFNMK